MLKEKTLQSEMVFKGNFIKVQRDQVLLPDGKTSQREYILHPGASLVIPILDDGRVVMLKQYRHACQQVFWEFPAGKIDQGEEPLKTAHRELEEEAGYKAGQMRYLTSIHPVIGYANEVIHIYRADQLQHVGAKLDEGEFVEVYTKTIDELKEMVRRGEVTDVKTQIGIFWLMLNW